MVTEATFEQSAGGSSRCEVTPSPGSNKCIRDVRSHVDEKCSGLARCQFMAKDLCRMWNGTCDGSEVLLKLSYDCLQGKMVDMCVANNNNTKGVTRK